MTANGAITLTTFTHLFHVKKKKKKKKTPADNY
jgi:hypothetical protein